MWGFILAIIIGGIAGWIAEKIMKVDHPWWLNIILGIVGAFVFTFIVSLIFPTAGGGIIWQLIAGIIGACLLIWIYRMFESRR